MERLVVGDGGRGGKGLFMIEVERGLLRNDGEVERLL